MPAFDFHQASLPAPAPPVAPQDTLGFHAPAASSPTSSEPGPGQPVSINLEAETPGLSLDPGVSGSVQLSYTAPPGVTAPSGNPASVTLSGGQANFTLEFPAAGYYRVAATGPNGAKGWVTVDVGTAPATALPQ